MNSEKENTKNNGLPPPIAEELDRYEEAIRKYRAGQIGEIKMQKIRLQLGTYHQRQTGVQMQRIKFPGGTISSTQLATLARAAEKYAGGFMHLTTREDVQLYYLKLEDCPDLMRDLARSGITTREACGNTVRNITACFCSGVSETEIFDTVPYAHALFRYLVRNKYNQVLSRKFKIAFEGCSEDHAGMFFHDFGFQARTRREGSLEKRGFRATVGGGLGGAPMTGKVYTEFLPEEELFNFAAATLRLFDRYGERKNRMMARMKFLIKKMGWEKFKEALDQERREVKIAPATVQNYLKAVRSAAVKTEMPGRLPENPPGREQDARYQAWRRDSVAGHRFPGFKGVHVRLKLGDITSDKALELAQIAEILSRGELRITLQQNFFLPWVPEKALPALHETLAKIGLADSGAETIEDTTTCPGADTCRLGITSAKGLGASISEALNNGMSRYKELARELRIKISGCPNGCAQHAMGHIGFQGAAMAKDGKTVPAHELFVGGEQNLDRTAFGQRIGKIPAKNGPKVVEAILELYSKERKNGEGFNACMARLGKERLQELIAPFTQIPSFEEDPEFYDDWGHENEKFAVRTGIKGECAGAPVQEKAPVMAEAEEKLAQAEALLTHQEWANALLQSYEAMAAMARVPLYAVLIDPFTSEQALWEFENVFVRSGRSGQEWLHLSETLEAEKKGEPTEANVKALLARAKKFLEEAKRLQAQTPAPTTPQAPAG